MDKQMMVGGEFKKKFIIDPLHIPLHSHEDIAWTLQRSSRKMDNLINARNQMHINLQIFVLVMQNKIQNFHL